MARITYTGTHPGRKITPAYESALQRWLKQQKRATGLYARAEEPLVETTEMFRPGGGYGAGQIALIEEEAKRAKAEALAEQVATGMSSGSLATATGLRVGRDVTRTKLGVEDVRTQFLQQALGQLAGLRGTQAGQVATTAEPYTPSYLGALTAQQQSETQEMTGAMRYAAAIRQDPSTLASQRMTAGWGQPKKKEEAPWASMMW